MSEPPHKHSIYVKIDEDGDALITYGGYEHWRRYVRHHWWNSEARFERRIKRAIRELITEHNLVAQFQLERKSMIERVNEYGVAFVENGEDKYPDLETRKQWSHELKT